MDTSVKYFSSTMIGAPELTGTAGSLIAVLDSFLVNGFGNVSISSLVISSGIATVTTNLAHNLTMIGSETGPVIQISGSTSSELNSEWRVLSITNAITFTFDCPDIPDGVASGTISVKRASAGWEKRYSDTNKAVYARLDPSATAMLLLVDDTDVKYSTMKMYESMTSINSGTLLATTYHFKTRLGTENNFTGARLWYAYADSHSFYLLNHNNFDYPRIFPVTFFGDLISLQSPDAFCCCLVGNSTNSEWYTPIFQLLDVPTGSFIARSHTSLGGVISALRLSHGISERISSAGAEYPNAAGNEFLCAPVEVWNDSKTVCRAIQPGFYNPLHHFSNFSDGQIISSPPYHEMQIRTIHGSAEVDTSAIAFDIAGPWR